MLLDLLGGAVPEEDALECGECEVEDDGDDRHEHGAAEYLHEVALGEAVEDVPAEPPKETYAAMVAVATTWMSASRSPVMIRGSARGSSTWKRTWCQRIPWPRAASRTSGSTAVIPA